MSRARTACCSCFSCRNTRPISTRTSRSKRLSERKDNNESILQKKLYKKHTKIKINYSITKKSKNNQIKMSYTLFISLLLTLTTIIYYRSNGLKVALISAPALINAFTILYCVIGFYLRHENNYYFLGIDFYDNLNSIYIVICLYNITFTISFLFFSELIKIKPNRKTVNLSHQFFLIYSAIFIGYPLINFSLLNSSGFFLHNVLMIFYNSLIPIIIITFIRDMKFSRLLLIIYTSVSIYIGFRYRLILLFIPIILYYFITKKINGKTIVKFTLMSFGSIITIAIVGSARSYSSGLDLDKLSGISFFELIVHGIFNDTSTVLTSGATIEYIEKTSNYSFFNQIYYIINYFIPSGIFPDKTYSPIFKYISTVTRQDSNESGAAVLGYVEYFHSAGYFGVIIFAILFALFYAYLFKKIRSIDGFETNLFIYLLFIGWYINSLTRGYLPQNTQDFIALYIGINIIFSKISRCKFSIR